MVPCGARISAGKLGRVARSLPNAAASEVKRSPVSCMPSPESPAKRITTRSSLLTSVGRSADTVPSDPSPFALVLMGQRFPLSRFRRAPRSILRDYLVFSVGVVWCDPAYP